MLVWSRTDVLAFAVCSLLQNPPLAHVLWLLLESCTAEQLRSRTDLLAFAVCSLLSVGCCRTLPWRMCWGRCWRRCWCHCWLWAV